MLNKYDSLVIKMISSVINNIKMVIMGIASYLC